MTGDEPIELTIHALAAGGDGVGKDAQGRTTFVAATAPGDRVRVRVVERHARWARAALVAIVAPGPARVAPPCPLFAARACGGCDWQHVALAAQHDAKQATLAGALRRLVAAGLSLAPLATPESPLHWRRRARWTVAQGALGYHGPRSRVVCDVAACPQLAPALEAVLTAIRARPGLLLGDGEIHAVIGATGAAHVVIDARCAPAAAAALVGQAGIAGVAWSGGTAGAAGSGGTAGAAGSGGTAGAAWSGGTAGAATIELEPGLHVRADEFAQAGARGNAALRAEVAAAVAVVPGERVLELFAGGGNFTRDLIAAGAAVTASDACTPAAPVASTAPTAGVVAGAAGPTSPAAPAARFVAGPAAEVVARLVAAGERFDAVVLDPPRTGARDVVGALAATGARRIVYVACDPATFARDADVLVAAGFAPRHARGLDLMPQTAHVELVARFDRR